MPDKCEPTGLANQEFIINDDGQLVSALKICAFVVKMGYVLPKAL